MTRAMRLFDENEAINALRNEFKRSPTIAIRAMEVIRSLTPVTPQPEMQSAYEDGYEKGYNDGFEVGQHDIQPERKTGKWINHRNDNGHNIADCSECGETLQWFDDGVEPNFCFNCGAKMEGIAE